MDNEEIEDTAYAEYAIDENGNVLDYFVYGKEACRVWAILALNIARGRYEIFDEDYGNELEDLIGSSTDQDYISAEAERMINECLSENEYINGITNFEMTLEEGLATLSFTINTVFGDEVIEDVQIQ